MNKKKKRKQLEQRFWSTFFSICVPAHVDEVPQHIDHVRMRLWDKVIDEYLEMMVTQVRSINMLDLDETDITNDGIEHLTKLDFIRELRLKGIREINDDCIIHLNKIKGLKLLHIRGTAVTLDGVLKLDALQELKQLFISDKNDEPDPEKIRQLRELMPDCEFVVNGQTFDVERDPYS